MGGKGKRLTIEEKNKILEMRLNGCLNPDIAYAIGVSERTVSRVCRANDISSPRFKGGQVSKTLNIANISRKNEVAFPEKNETPSTCVVINRAISVVGLYTEYLYILNAKNKTVIMKNDSGDISIHLSEIDGIIDELSNVKKKLEKFNVGAEMV